MIGYETYTDPLGSPCVNRRDYQIPENSTETGQYTPQETTRMRNEQKKEKEKEKRFPLIF